MIAILRFNWNTRTLREIFTKLYYIFYYIKSYLCKRTNFICLFIAHIIQLSRRSLQSSIKVTGVRKPFYTSFDVSSPKSVDKLTLNDNNVSHVKLSASTCDNTLFIRLNIHRKFVRASKKPRSGGPFETLKYLPRSWSEVREVCPKRNCVAVDTKSGTPGTLLNFISGIELTRDCRTRPE